MRCAMLVVAGVLLLSAVCHGKKEEKKEDKEIYDLETLESMDYYEVLRVGRFVEPSQVKSAFRKLAKKWHPDLHDNKELAQAVMKRLNEAKDTLQDEEKRTKYDRMLATMNSINAFAKLVGGDLPAPVMIYVTCPVYMEFRWNTLIASFICTSMVLSHIPIALLCYLFYKYAMWGDVPEAKRSFMEKLTIPVRVFMLFLVTSFVLVLMLSFFEYLMYLTFWIVVPCVVGHLVDKQFCVAVKKEKKNVGPAGMQKTVEKKVHMRPAWVPVWCSLTDFTALVGDKIAQYDNNPVVTIEKTKNGEYENVARQCDLDREKAKEQEVLDRQRSKKEAQVRKRREMEDAREARLSPKNASD